MALLSLSSSDMPKISINERDALGIGSYGKVVRAKIGKQHCAAKLLHDTMFLFNDPGLQNFVRKFGEECRLLSRIDHPNVVKYLGTTSDPKSGRTVLLMELMHESLTKFLERSPDGPLPYYPQFSIGHDVALALAYLHSRSIIHRDLSSNNVLLTADGMAKVTDFGMSRLIEMNSRATPLTQCPGTLVYMPPKALITPPQYSDKLDCFSFGILTIQIATRKFPDPGNANKYVEDPKYPSGRVIIQIPETERRKKHIDLVEPDHPLLPLAIKCLENRDTRRPSAHELCEELAPLKEQEQQKKEEEVKELQLKREVEEKERQRREELEEQARREERRHRKEEKDKKRLARREAKAADRAEAARKKEEQGLDDSSKLLVWLFPTLKQKPRHFIEDGFDLDLTYIKPNIIAMARPGEKVEGLLRNKMQDVIRFLDRRHPDHYKVYNLSSERLYDPGRFHQRVATYPFDEDNPPPFELIKPFCDDMDIWLKKDDRNVAAIHCSDGLGRTGTMLASYLMHDKLFETSNDALSFFGEARTHTATGVTIPSQRRYVRYYSHLIRSQLKYEQKTVLLKGIRLEGIPHFGSGGCSLRFAAYLYKTRIFVSKVCETIGMFHIIKGRRDDFVDLTLEQPLPLCGDIKIVFYNKRSRIFRFWFNTNFVDVPGVHQEAQGLGTGRDLNTFLKSINLTPQSFTVSATQSIVLPKAELDGAHEDAKHYPQNFKVRVMISDLMPPGSSSDTPVDSASALSDYKDDDLTDLSDTDPEEEWDLESSLAS